MLATAMLMAFAACEGNDGSNGNPGEVIFVNCPPFQQVIVVEENDTTSSACEDLPLAQVRFILMDDTVKNPRPGESIEGRDLIINDGRLVVEEMIPGWPTPQTQEYITTELGSPLIFLHPNIPIRVLISAEGFLPTTLNFQSFTPGFDGVLEYSLMPLWVLDEDGATAVSQPIIVQVTIETVDVTGGANIDTVEIINPIFNLVVKDMQITSPTSVTLDGDVNINGIVIEDPTIITNGTIEVDANGIVIQGDDITVAGSGDTTVEFDGVTNIAIEGDVELVNGITIDADDVIVFDLP